MARTEERELYVALNDVELKARSDELAPKVEAVNLTKSQAKAVARDYRKKVEDLEDGRDNLARVVKECREVRTVMCAWAENWNRHTMELYRDDTGELVTTRDMTGEERQMKLRLVELDQRVNEPKEG